MLGRCLQENKKSWEKSLRHPPNGASVTFTQAFDTAAHVTQLTSSANDPQHPGTLATVNSTVGYFPTGAIRSVHLGNSITETTAYNNRLQPCRINANDSNSTLNSCTDALPLYSMQDYSYGFNSGSANNGNIGSWQATGWLNFNRSYSYDMLNRLSTMSDSASSQPCKGLSWTYDAWGNRTDQTVTSGTCNTFHNSVNTNNQLIGPPYQYDAAGNMTQDASHTYAYDAENRLISVDGGSTATYTYDALGRRVHRAGAGVALPTDYFYDLSGNVVTEFAPSCSGVECWTVGYVYLNGRQIAEYKNSTTYFHHKDHLGSTHLVSDVTAAYITDCFDFYPFGELNTPTTPCSSGNSAPSHSNTTHEFTGDERDSESNLDHTLFRQYSSSLGRWMHPDPAGLAAVDPSNPQSWNRYSYVLNNPLNLVDPLGLCGGGPGANGDPCTPFSYTDGNGCVVSVTYSQGKGSDGNTYDIPNTTTNCTGSPYLNFWAGICPSGFHLVSVDFGEPRCIPGHQLGDNVREPRDRDRSSTNHDYMLAIHDGLKNLPAVCSFSVSARFGPGRASAGLQLITDLGSNSSLRATYRAQLLALGPVQGSISGDGANSPNATVSVRIPDTPVTVGVVTPDGATISGVQAGSRIKGLFNITVTANIANAFQCP